MKSLPRSIQPVADFCFKHLPCSAVAEIGEVSAGRRGLNAPIYRGFVSFNPSPRDECPSVSPLYHFVAQGRSVNTPPSPLLCQRQKGYF